MHSLPVSSDCQPGSYSHLPFAFTFSIRGRLVNRSLGCCETHICPIAQKRFLSSHPFVAEDDLAGQPQTWRPRARRSANGDFPSDDDRTLEQSSRRQTISTRLRGLGLVGLPLHGNGGFRFTGSSLPSLFSPKACSYFFGRGRGFAYSDLISSPPKKSPQNRGGFVKIASQPTAIQLRASRCSQGGRFLQPQP